MSILMSPASVSSFVLSANVFIVKLIKYIISPMIPKIKNCVDAVENGVRGVVILDGRKPHSILHEIFSDTGSGTLIRKWEIYLR